MSKSGINPSGNVKKVTFADDTALLGVRLGEATEKPQMRQNFFSL